jgi:glycosyltransferase involved in cell wall biosynthesis
MSQNTNNVIEPIIGADINQLVEPKDRMLVDWKEVIELSIVMPCLNEAETLAICIGKAQKFLDHHHIKGEIIVADNGSTDGSQEIALSTNVRLVHINQKGYGAALMGGIEAARGEFIIMGDSDDSYDFNNLMSFMDKLREGFDLVMGNRFKGGIMPGAMPFLHRYLGNPVLSSLGRLFFRIPIGDFHCGLRGFKKASIVELDLRTNGMEFASEMIVKAGLHGLNIIEVPTTLSPDGRSRCPHLRTWRDGWRHLRFLLLFSPDWLFLIPGGMMFCLGSLLLFTLLAGPIRIGSLFFDFHYMVLGSMLVLLGFQVINIGIFAKFFALVEKFVEQDILIQRFLRLFNLERGSLLGIFIFGLGLLINLIILSDWVSSGFGGQHRIREAILAMTLMVIGVQVVFSSFFLSLLGIKKS